MDKSYENKDKSDSIKPVDKKASGTQQSKPRVDEPRHTSGPEKHAEPGEKKASGADHSKPRNDETRHTSGPDKYSDKR